MDQGLTIMDAVAVTIARRNAARAEMQKAERELEAAGIAIKDTPQGTVWGAAVRCAHERCITVHVLARPYPVHVCADCGESITPPAAPAMPAGAESPVQPLAVQRQ